MLVATRYWLDLVSVFQDVAICRTGIRHVSTAGGHRFLAEWCAVGLMFAIVAFSISAVSFAVLIDRRVSATDAILTSFRVVARNPLTMALWGLICAGLLFVAIVPIFLGLAVVMPVLGHATWHLYRKAVNCA